MSIIGSNILAGASGQAGGGGAYEVERSVRFSSSDSAYLGATFGTPTDQDVFTLSMWVKRSALGSTQHLFGVSTNHSFGFTSGDALNLTFGGSSALTTTALFRDPSAWYHIMWVQNGTAHTLYVNGASVGTATATSSTFNTAVAHQIGAGNTANFFSGYLAYIHFIDGQAKPPSSFGANDNNGIWQPLVYAGGYGNNGFQLEMDDNSTAAALGTDTSSNGNDWTVNNISATAGAGNDSLVDSPVNGSQVDTGVGGEVVGNYCTWNPLTGAITLTNGNLDGNSTGAAFRGATGTAGVFSGKWYWESTIQNTDSGNYYGEFGFIKTTDITGAITNPSGMNGIVYYARNGRKISGGTSVVTSSSGATTGDVVQVAVDLDAGKIWFGVNNTWVDSGNPASGTDAAYTGLSGTYLPTIGVLDGGKCNALFGQRAFAYTAPSGFKALTTANLPEGTITTSGTFTGNANANGPFVWLNGVPTAMTINGNAVTFATHADKLSNGFKVRTSSGSYNTAGSNTYSISTTGAKLKYARAQTNP
jgi:hypothetical protein